MKNLVYMGLATFFLFSCTSEPAEAIPEEILTEDSTIVSVEAPDILVEDVTIYSSSDMGMLEYLKLVKEDSGQRNWYYYTEKKPKEIKLGVTKRSGLEVLYFYTKPEVLYTIGGSECGFMLESEEESQWYEQIQPACDME